MTYCIKCDQCGTLSEDGHATYRIDCRLWNFVDEAEERVQIGDPDFCSMACLILWAQAYQAKGG